MKRKNDTGKLTLKVTPRTVVGKKIKKLRNQGFIPANIFGSDFKSRSISVVIKEFINVYKIARETGVIYLELEKKELPVLITNVQRHPVNDNILHVDFRKIDLSKKIETSVPVKAAGESEAVNQKGGVLLIQTESLLVEALPEDIPTKIEIDISIIKDIGQEIKVNDLVKSDKYEIKAPPEKVIFSVVAHKEESVTPETTAAAPEIITEAEKGEETPSEGTPTEAGKEEKTKETPATKPETPPKK